jgi:hypothetical protein
MLGSRPRPPLAYVLSDVLDIPSAEAAFIWRVTPAAFRNRASRARTQLQEFGGVQCGLVNKPAVCRCDRRVTVAIRDGRVEPDHLAFVRDMDPGDAVGEMEKLHDVGSLMRSQPDYAAPQAVNEAVRAVINSGHYKILQ